MHSTAEGSANVTSERSIGDVPQEAIARGVLQSLSEDKVIITVPGTDYQLHFVPNVPAAAFKAKPGDRIKGMIHANALRIHPFSGGGRYIEPVWGMPRIVAGKVLSADASKKQAIISFAVPFIVNTMEGQKFEGILEPGRMVNCYLQSGSTFTPMHADA